MTASRFASVGILAFALAGGAAAEGFKVYPGAKKYTPPDNEQTRAFMDALRPGTTITAYLTSDSFEQVVFFYKTFAKEYTSPGKHPSGKLPNGGEIRKTFLIFDGAPDLLKSKSWASVQHPFIGSVSVKAGAPQYRDVRDVTEIVLTERKEVPKAKN
jgi:hypothetical protein